MGKKQIKEEVPGVRDLGWQPQKREGEGLPKGATCSAPAVRTKTQDVRLPGKICQLQINAYVARLQSEVVCVWGQALNKYAGLTLTCTPVSTSLSPGQGLAVANAAEVIFALPILLYISRDEDASN